MNIGRDNIRDTRTMVKILIALFVISLGVYFNSLNNEFIGDDGAIILENPLMGSIGNVYKPFIQEYWKDIPDAAPGAGIYRPLVVASFIIEYAFWGPNPLPFRLLNILSHAMVAVVVFFLALTLLEKLLPSSKNRVKISAAAALIFAVHPSHCEAVNLVVGRADIWATLFILSGFLMYLKGRIFPSVLLYIAALFSKEVSFIFIPLLLLYECAVRFQSFRPQRYIGFILVTLVYLPVRFFAIGSTIVPTAIYFPDLNIFQRFFVMSKAVFIYLKVLFYPATLSVFYDPLRYVTPIEDYRASLIISSVFLIILISFAIWHFSRKSKVSVLLSFPVLFFFVGIIPTSNVFRSIGAFMNERFLYFPSIGFSLLMAMVLVGFKKSKAWSSLLLIPLVLFFSFRTVTRNYEWKDELTLWLAEEEIEPVTPYTYYLIARTYNYAGDNKNAISYYRNAIRNYPQFVEAHFNLGKTLEEDGMDNEAIQSYEKADQFAESGNWAIKEKLAAIYLRQKDFDKATELYENLEKSSPQELDYKYKLAYLYNRKAEREKVMKTLRDIIRIKPDDAQAWNDLAWIYAEKKKDVDKGIKFALMADKIMPDNAGIIDTMGWAYYKKGWYSKAAESFERAYVLMPENDEIEEHLILARSKLQAR